MTTSTTTNKHSRTDLATAILNGIKLHLTSNVVLNGTTYTPAELEAAVQKVIDVAQTTAQQRQNWANAITAERDADGAFRLLVSALQAWVIATFGASSSAMGDFGFKPRKKAKVKPATKAKAVVQAKATKKARGIMGKKQRKAIVAPPPPAPTETTSTKTTDVVAQTNGVTVTPPKNG